MWILNADRRILAEILLGNGIDNLLDYNLADNFPKTPNIGDNLYLIWDSDPRIKKIPPSLIIVADNRLKDFLAWVVTYFSNFRPFTAYFRVFEFSTLESFIPWLEPPSLNGIESACIGLIIAESYILSSTAARPVLMTLSNCSSTLSYVLVRALSLGAHSNQINRIYDRWVLSRRITNQPERIMPSAEIKNICDVLYLLRQETIKQFEKDTFNKNVNILTACSEIYNAGRVSDDTWRIITNNSDALGTAHQQMIATREERVLYFQKIMTENSVKLLESSDIHAFVCGYLASMIAPGSFSHIDLLGRIQPLLPAARLWYGLCAGLQKKNEVLTLYQCLGRLLLRELLRYEPLLSLPNCDMALDELTILMEGNGLSNFPPYLTSRTIVEIYPCISTDIRWPKGETKKNGDGLPKSEDINQRVKLLSDLGNRLEQAIDIYKKLTDQGQKKLSEPKRHLPKQKKKKNSELFSEDK